MRRGRLGRFRIERAIGILAVLNLAMIAILLGPPRFSNASRPLGGLSDPVLAMEMVRDAADVDAILSNAPSADREAMRIKQYADFGFIAAYGALFIAVGLWLRPLGYMAAILGVVAAICDVKENLAILRIVDTGLAQTTQGMVDAVYYPSLIKWTLASLAMGLLSVLMIRTRRTGLLTVGGFYGLTALLGLYGVYEHRGLAWLGLPMLGGLIGLAVLYFRPRANRR